jgi:hypothetical protein
MKLVATKRPSREKADHLRYVRDDGTACECAMPRQGILPHDLIHYVVESRLRLANGFLSLVAAGADAQFVMAAAHGESDDTVKQEAIQAEALVEALQTQLWNGRFDREAFLYGVEGASKARDVLPPSLPVDGLEPLLYDTALALQRRWAELAPYASLELPFSPNAG